MLYVKESKGRYVRVPNELVCTYQIPVTSNSSFQSEGENGEK
jgi:hypothetical protein